MTAGSHSTSSAEQQPALPSAVKGELKSHHIIADSANTRFDSPAGSVISEADAAQEAEEQSTENQQQPPLEQDQQPEQGQSDQQLEQQPEQQLEQQQQDACTAEMQRLSALEANIEGKGQHSYYYAHKRKDTGEEPAPLPVAVVLERCVEAPTELFTTIFSYQFLDEKVCVRCESPSPCPVLTNKGCEVFWGVLGIHHLSDIHRHSVHQPHMLCKIKFLYIHKSLSVQV